MEDDNKMIEYRQFLQSNELEIEQQTSDDLNMKEFERKWSDKL